MIQFNVYNVMLYSITCFYYRVDRDRSGTITANELQSALSNGNYGYFVML